MSKPWWDESGVTLSLLKQPPFNFFWLDALITLWPPGKPKICGNALILDPRGARHLCHVRFRYCICLIYTSTPPDKSEISFDGGCASHFHVSLEILDFLHQIRLGCCSLPPGSNSLWIDEPTDSHQTPWVLASGPQTSVVRAVYHLIIILAHYCIYF